MNESTESKKKVWGGKRERLVVDELMTRQVASMLLVGKNATEIAQELNISYTAARGLINRDDVRDMLKDAGETALQQAKSVVRRGAAQLAELTMEVLKEHLKDERSLEAVKVTLKVLGVMDQEPGGPQTATAIQVIMPGAEKPIKGVASEQEHE